MSKELYCWHCQKVVPMLSELEWAIMAPTFNKVYLKHCTMTFWGPRMENVSEEEHQRCVQAALKLFHLLTGYEETNVWEIRNHRLSFYGPPCRVCGKPLRTPQAKLCAACGASRAPLEP